MKMNFGRGTLIGCASLVFLSAAGCSAGTEGEEVASVAQAACIDDVSGTCSAQCDRGFDYEVQACFDQCVFGYCGDGSTPLPPPPPPPPPPVSTWPWTVSCESSIDFGVTRTDYVSVSGSLRPGSETLPGTFAEELRNAATAPCDALVRQTYRTQCSTLDRAATLRAYVGRTTSGLGPSPVGPTFYTYTWSNPRPIASIPVADLCPVRNPPPGRPCGGRPCP
jgi:hypothetical protein